MANFHVVNIAYDIDTSYGEPHKLFYKRHISSEPTIFLMNVPPYCNEDSLKKLFADCGRIKSAILVPTPKLIEQIEKQPKLLEILKKKTKNFQYAYIVFENESSLDVALEMSRSKAIRYLNTDTQHQGVGMQKWIKEYSEEYPKESYLQSIVNEFMVEYDLNEAKKKEAKKNEGEVDDDGWVTIPVKKKPNQDAVAAKKKWEKKLEKKKRSEKDLKSFYLFQQREEKREKVAALRLKFEDDKKRITQLRQERKFKPF